MCNAGALRPFRARFDPTLSDGSHPNFYTLDVLRPAVSGGDPVESRPGFIAMLKRIDIRVT